MADTPAPNGSSNGSPPERPAPAAGETPRAPLDDVMIAMDVVDTLRHDTELVERELDDEQRRRKLIDRLREIYRGQGIEVPDRILEEGVQALEEQRFQYTPPKDGLAVRLARLYVSRNDWGRTLGGIALGIALVWSGWYVMVERPRQARVVAERTELNRTLPDKLRTTAERIAATGADAATRTRAETVRDQGIKAAAAGDRTAARAASAELDGLLASLSQTYTIRVVNRRGELTGFWRVPRVNPNARNFYLVVEAVDASGKVVPLDIVNEETSKRERVSTWAVRVPEAVFDEIRADKADDGIIQKATLATKRRGQLEPDWRIGKPAGALTRWSRT